MCYNGECSSLSRDIQGNAGPGRPDGTVANRCCTIIRNGFIDKANALSKSILQGKHMKESTANNLGFTTYANHVSLQAFLRHANAALIHFSLFMRHLEREECDGETFEEYEKLLFFLYN